MEATLTEELYVREIVMTKFERILCIIGLTLLRHQLNNSRKFEAWVRKGISRIKVWNSPSYYWYSLTNKIFRKNLGMRFFHKFDLEDYDQDILRQALAMLRDTLNNKQAFSDLVEIGTRWLTMPCPSEVKSGADNSILIGNNVGCAYPNSDYSLYEIAKIWYHG